MPMRVASVYAGLSARRTTISRSLWRRVKAGQNAARSLHNQMLDGLLKAMAFFDAFWETREPFSKDLYTIDEELPVTLAMWLSVATSCSATMAAVRSRRRGFSPLFYL